MQFITSGGIPATISPFYICLSFFITIFALFLVSRENIKLN